MPSGQLCEINVHRSAESVPTSKSFWLHALKVPKGIADILKIEAHTALFEACPLTSPIPKEVPVRALARFMTVRAGERFLLRRL